MEARSVAGSERRRGCFAATAASCSRRHERKARAACAYSARWHAATRMWQAMSICSWSSSRDGRCSTCPPSVARPNGCSGAGQRGDARHAQAATRSRRRYGFDSLRLRSETACSCERWLSSEWPEIDPLVVGGDGHLKLVEEPGESKQPEGGHPGLAKP